MKKIRLTFEYRLKAILWMTIGSLAVLAFSLVMNQFNQTPTPQPKQAVSNFQVERIEPPKPKPKPKPEPKPKPKSSPKAPPPSIGSQLGGLDMGLGFDMSLGNDDALLGDTSDVVMSSEAVDVAPKATTQTAMNYPKAALRDKISGYVLLNVLIDTKGEVERVSIEESVPEGVFDDAARSGVSNWKFQPALYKGEKVKVWAKQKIRFSLD